jgi:hypothetical protein
MRWRHGGAAIVALAMASRGVAADVTPVVGRDARRSVAVTVYDRDLGVVTETREVDLPAGESDLRFEDVPARIDARTVAVRSVSEPERFTVVSQQYVFDPLSPEKLMEQYVGREVELVETDPKLRTQTTRATLLSTTGGPVYRIGDRIALGHPGRVVLPALPAGLYARPTLLWRVANRGAGRHTIEVSYLTGGLAWEADYVALVDAGDTRADLTAWVSLTNTSGARYDDATLRLVAGDVHRAERPPGREPLELRAAPMAAAPRFVEEGLFEYHLYTLDRPATLVENATEQLPLLAARGVPVAKRYVVTGQPAWFRSPQGDLARDVPVEVFLELRNDAASRLGMPLPAGVVRLYTRDRSGARQLVGEDRIAHTAKDELVRLQAGKAFDVDATRVQTDYRQLTVKPYDAEVAFAVTVRNHKPAPVVVTVREPVGGDWKVVESSQPPEKIDARTLGFEAKVPADGETVVTYRVQIAYR